LPCVFHSISSIVDATHAPTTSQMIWSTSYHHVTLLVHRSLPHLFFTVAFIHRCQVLLKLHRHAVHRSKASNLPFTLATNLSSEVLYWSFSNLLTWLNVMSHIQWAPSSHVWALQQIQATFFVMAWVAHTSVPID
jgi:hypothetical protein